MWWKAGTIKHPVQIVDAPILETNGFGILKDKAQLNLLRRVAATRGLIVFTDSDGAGFVIRNFLKGAIPKEHLLHAYIPDIPARSGGRLPREKKVSWAWRA